ncbi:MAG TPA: hypothetical protein VMG59_02460 [Phycisphaerae bacterium]|nr:hypothetical protein [Phycisphaerae bacterium]
MRKYLLRFVAFTILLISGIAPALSQTTSNNGIILKIVSDSTKIVSGYPIALSVSIANHSSLPFCFVDPRMPETFFACNSGGPSLTRYGRSIIGTLLVPGSHPTLPTNIVGPGKSTVWGIPFPLTRLYDLSLPSTYQIRLQTQRDIYLVNGTSQIYISIGNNIAIAKAIGKRLYLPSFGENLQQPQFIADGIAESNSLLLTILPPAGQPPVSALIPAQVMLSPISGSVPGGVSMSFITASGNNSFPTLLWVYLYAGKTPIQIRLTGDPMIDFHDTKVDGPDGINGDELIEKPEPHYGPIPNWESVPLTAYGEWMSKQKMPKDLTWKTYVLEPNMIYKYAIPINLGCQFDMSMSGKYHIRLSLVNSTISSAWTDIFIPGVEEQKR